MTQASLGKSVVQKEIHAAQNNGVAANITHTQPLWLLAEVTYRCPLHCAFEATVLEAFELEGCYLQKVTYQGGDYTSSDPLDIAMTITFDNAIQTNASGNPVGIGQNVGRAINTLATG